MHEVKHDGWRAQLHLHDGTPRIYSKRGVDLTCRFRPIADAIARLPAKSLILDAELVACDAEGKPSFGALMSGPRHGCCAYVFDLMQDDAEMHTAAPLDYRRARLRKLLKRAKLDALRFSDDFDDPVDTARGVRPARARGHRVEVARGPLSVRHQSRLGQGQDSGMEGRQPGALAHVREIEMTDEPERFCRYRSQTNQNLWLLCYIDRFDEDVPKDVIRRGPWRGGTGHVIELRPAVRAALARERYVVHESPEPIWDCLLPHEPREG